jgi:hypothetical protein
MARFLNTVHTEDLGYYQGRLVRGLLEPLIWIHDNLRREIPVGFESDGASVPRLPLIYDAWGDKAHREAFGHDYDYRKDSFLFVVASTEINEEVQGPIPNLFILRRIPIVKEDADWHFRITMRDHTHVDADGNVANTYSYLTYQPMYWAVRTCGDSSFHRMSVMDHFKVVQ